jgi:hypothetical protein
VACSKRPTPIPSSPAASPSSSNDRSKDSNCKSHKLTIGILAQVEQDSLLVVRSEPDTGDIIGRIGPLSVVNIVDGPDCTGGAVWWKLNFAILNLSGWTTENNLYACSKEDRCN